MKIIKQIFQKLFNTFNKYYSKNTKLLVNQKDDNYIGSIQFKITSNKDIDIIYNLPDVTAKSTTEVSDLSEIYARFLLYINDGYLKQDIIDSLQNSSKNNPNADPNYHLLIDNIIFNWAMIHVSKKEKKAEKSNQPLIRPISVFHHT